MCWYYVLPDDAPVTIAVLPRRRGAIAALAALAAAYVFLIISAGEGEDTLLEDCVDSDMMERQATPV
jgi:hypothetical protein